MLKKVQLLTFLPRDVRKNTKNTDFTEMLPLKYKTIQVTPPGDCVKDTEQANNGGVASTKHLQEEG